MYKVQVIDGKKECTKCGAWKLLSDFGRRNDRPLGLQSRCLVCTRAYHRYYNQHQGKDIRQQYEKTDKCKAQRRLWARTSEKHKICRANYERKIEVKTRRKRWQQSNNGCACLRAATAKRRATQLKATPLWLTKLQLQEMKDIYRLTPIGYEVDHIVPLQGKDVCGLHVPWNLQYLTIKQNRSKGNGRTKQTTAKNDSI
jgi:hypothetical protein